MLPPFAVDPALRGPLERRIQSIRRSTHDLNEGRPSSQPGGAVRHAKRTIRIRPREATTAIAVTYESWSDSLVCQEPKALRRASCAGATQRRARTTTHKIGHRMELHAMTAINVCVRLQHFATFASPRCEHA